MQGITSRFIFVGLTVICFFLVEILFLVYMIGSVTEFFLKCVSLNTVGEVTIFQQICYAIKIDLPAFIFGNALYSVLFEELFFRFIPIVIWLYFLKKDFFYSLLWFVFVSMVFGFLHYGFGSIFIQGVIGFILFVEYIFLGGHRGKFFAPIIACTFTHLFYNLSISSSFFIAILNEQRLVTTYVFVFLGLILFLFIMKPRMYDCGKKKCC